MTMQLVDMIEKSRNLDEGKQDMTTVRSGVVYGEMDGRLALSVDSGFIGMSPYMPMQRRAVIHACGRLSAPPTHYIADVCPPELAAYNMNHWQQTPIKRDQKWFIRSIKGDGGLQEVRACLSEFYSPIANTELLEMVQDFTTGMGGEVIRGYVDADTLHLKMILFDDETSNYGFGFYLGNGEVGNRALRVSPLVQRHSCTNSIVVAGDTYYQKHFRVSPARLRGDIKDELGKALRTAPETLETIVKAEMDAIPDLRDVVAGICKNKGFSEHLIGDILIGTEGRKTRMGLVNGLSYAAHAAAEVDQESRIDMEFFAGAVLQATNHEVHQMAKSRSRLTFQAD